MCPRSLCACPQIRAVLEPPRESRRRDLATLPRRALHAPHVGRRFCADAPPVAAGRAAAVAQLRDLATRLEQLPFDAVAEALVLLEPTLDDLRRQAALALDRAPAGRL